MPYRSKNARPGSKLLLAAAIGCATFAVAWTAAAETHSSAIEDITGNWTDKSGTGGNITIKAATGLLLVKGKDKNSVYKLGCVSTGAVATCVGNGLSNAGKGFIYQSMMRLTKDGNIVETWLVRNSVSERNGQTLWVRK